MLRRHIPFLKLLTSTHLDLILKLIDRHFFEDGMQIMGNWGFFVDWRVAFSGVVASLCEGSKVE